MKLSILIFWVVMYSYLQVDTNVSKEILCLLRLILQCVAKTKLEHNLHFHGQCLSRVIVSITFCLTNIFMEQRTSSETDTRTETTNSTSFTGPEGSSLYSRQSAREPYHNSNADHTLKHFFKTRPSKAVPIPSHFRIKIVCLHHFFHWRHINTSELKLVWLFIVNLFICNLFNEAFSVIQIM
jgi:hypothetical protein